LLEFGVPQKVLEIGTGSGYQAAVLATLVPQVFTVERIEELLRQARRRFRQLGLANVRTRHDDGKLGWATEAPFDGIILTAAGDTIPSRILDQLSPTGVLVGPVGSPSRQTLIRMRGDGHGDFVQEELGAVSFVPLLGGIG
jgi:protein-L-isoaspartate(D-aspartate) O-methyltransferase